ncbi:hypothetical protein KKG83_05715 [Candidatus Micrarchaeota archaeon]|nr:hypothetical protein [Candidatus Micrarchaeota archaeon]MBU2476941.1 hypothetical protein [Candidatus Micrarchaeota archaeon]
MKNKFKVLAFAFFLVFLLLPSVNADLYGMLIYPREVTQGNTINVTAALWCGSPTGGPAAVNSFVTLRMENIWGQEIDFWQGYTDSYGYFTKSIAMNYPVGSYIFEALATHECGSVYLIGPYYLHLNSQAPIPCGGFKHPCAEKLTFPRDYR